MFKSNLPCGIREIRFVLLLVVSCLPALAQSNAVSSFAYGPQTFTRASGASAVQTVTFSVPPLVDGPFTLIVQRESHGGDVGTVSLNGVQLFGIRDFQSKGTFQALVTLNTGIDETTGEAATNTLAVELM